MTTVPTVPAGWYGDPQAPQQLRYWDGASWTAHVAARPATTYAAPARAHGVGESPDDALHWIMPTGRSWETIASGYLGLLSLVIFVLGPFAVVLGIQGIRRAGREGSHGRGRAIFGIATGTIGTLLGLVVLVDILNG